ncbi:cysteine desulfurase [Halanaerobium sp. Z-7514]|uniref:Cysteine desulfurase n=1 Tax=Halanaerobium polyolivorans TaxID=2886943 RepID=A0AAW4WY90_9FIRM|nr:cysteine desulfurase family protein [Halanaerobium polyolivorans]MCC3144392.1 cysteine desulfurase [Halanaerobium polyolivorans]RQD70146.1 MAG: cysteine desulfurase [Halanaerobium sp. MSAO_Bac5]
MPKEIYLDNAATSKVSASVIEALSKAMQNNYANPSSLHSKGLAAEKILKKCRANLAERLKIKAEEIIFTSGGTESNNLALRGIINQHSQRGKHLITSQIEHSSVYELMLQLEDEGWEVDYLEVNKKGIVKINDLKNLIREDTVLVSIMHVNNELGSIQPIKKISEIIKQNNPLTFFHVDGVQAFGKIFADLTELKVDLYSISGHKFHAPKGIGALFLKKGIALKPLFYGGGQERALRPGTENTAAIAGLNRALAEITALNKDNPFNAKLNKKKNYFLKKLKTIKEIKINSPKNSAPHIINFSLKNIKGETMVHALAEEGIYLSTSSACTSKNKYSRVLKACGFSEQRNQGALRISLSEQIKQSDIDKVISKIKEKIDFLKII